MVFLELNFIPAIPLIKHTHLALHGVPFLQIISKAKIKVVQGPICYSSCVILQSHCSPQPAATTHH